MSSPRLSQLILPLFVCAPLFAGGCSPPAVAVAAASYGTDAASVASTGKTVTDHYASVVTKKDCALWRALRNQDVCRDRDMNHDVYHVNYDEPFRQQSESGTEYGPAPHSDASAPPASWDAAAYKTGPQHPASTIAVSDNPPLPTTSEPAPPPAKVAQADAPQAPAAPVKQKHKKKKAKPADATNSATASTSGNAPTQPSPGQVVSSR